MSRTKQDRELVAGDADHEVKTVQAKMKKEGITISAQAIRNLIIEFGHSRRNLYKIIRGSFNKIMEQPETQADGKL